MAITRAMARAEAAFILATLSRPVPESRPEPPTKSPTEPHTEPHTARKRLVQPSRRRPAHNRRDINNPPPKHVYTPDGRLLPIVSTGLWVLCPLCPHTSSSHDNVRKHLARVHDFAHLRRDKCARCSKMFTTAESRRAHLRTCLQPTRPQKHHHIRNCHDHGARRVRDPAGELMVIEALPDVRRVRCPLCDLAFLTVASVRRHLFQDHGWLHLGAHQCDTCGVRFECAEMCIFHRATTDSPSKCMRRREIRAARPHGPRVARLRGPSANADDYLCPHCGLLVRAAHAKTHLVMRHAELYPELAHCCCRFCRRSFSHACHLTQHSKHCFWRSILTNASRKRPAHPSEPPPAKRFAVAPFCSFGSRAEL